MKREILFKAKRIDNGGWIEGDLLQTEIIEIFKDALIKVNPSTVCQFTGLLDKNGKKIFEGDKFGDFTIEYNSSLARFGAYNHESHDFIGVKIWEEFTITGNIHD